MIKRFGAQQVGNAAENGFENLLFIARRQQKSVRRGRKQFKLAVALQKRFFRRLARSDYVVAFENDASCVRAERANLQVPGGRTTSGTMR